MNSPKITEIQHGLISSADHQGILFSCHLFLAVYMIDFQAQSLHFVVEKHPGSCSYYFFCTQACTFEFLLKNQIFSNAI